MWFRDLISIRKRDLYGIHAGWHIGLGKGRDIKKPKPDALSRSGFGRFRGGGDLLSHFRSIIDVVRFNFSVRNGKRWSPHAIATLVRLSVSTDITGLPYKVERGRWKRR